MKLIIWAVTVFFVTVSCAVVADADTLFPYDTAITLSVIDDSLEPLDLAQPIYFHGNEYKTLKISENGMVTFESDFYGGINLPLEKKWIAPFGADVVPYMGGTMKYQIFTGSNQAELTKANDLVLEVFTDDTFQAVEVTVVTWLQVKKSSSSAEENTFQLALPTDSTGRKTYAIFLYGKIEWYPAEIGVSAGDSSSVFRVCDTDKYGTTFMPIKSNNQCGSKGVIVFRLHETTWNQPTYTCTPVYTAITCRVKPGIAEDNRGKRCMAYVN